MQTILNLRMDLERKESERAAAVREKKLLQQILDATKGIEILKKKM